MGIKHYFADARTGMLIRVDVAPERAQDVERLPRHWTPLGAEEYGRRLAAQERVFDALTHNGG